MYGKKIKFTDYNGVEREETFYFNLNKAELTELQLGTTGGFTALIRRMIETHDQPSLIKIVKQVIRMSYGVKSDDGKRFIKSEQLSDEFEQTEAYVNLYMELATDDKASAEFINGIMPNDVREELRKNPPKDLPDEFKPALAAIQNN